MATFEYRGFHEQGRSCHGMVDAVNAKDAREKLAKEGILAERIWRTGKRVRFSLEVRALMYRELSALLGAGLPLLQAVRFMVQSSDLTRHHVFLAGVADRVSEGASLTDALTGAVASISDFERALIAAGERSGALPIVLQNLSSFMDTQVALREKIQTALIYPAAVIGLGICSAILMLGVFIPRMNVLLTSGGMSLPLLTRMAIATGKALTHWAAVAILLAAAGGIVWLARRRRTDTEFRRAWDRRMFHMPITGKAYTLLVNLRFSQTLAILLENGVPAVEGFAMAGRATGSVWVAHLAENESDTVRHGQRISDALQRIPPLAGFLPGWVRTGEVSGGLSALLQNAAKRYEDLLNRYVSKGMVLLELVLILLVGGFVLLIALAVLLPVFSLSQGVTM